MAGREENSPPDWLSHWYLQSSYHCPWRPPALHTALWASPGTSGLHLSDLCRLLCACRTCQPWPPGVAGCLSALFHHPVREPLKLLGAVSQYFEGWHWACWRLRELPLVYWPQRAHTGHGVSSQGRTLGINSQGHFALGPPNLLGILVSPLQVWPRKYKDRLGFRVLPLLNNHHVHSQFKLLFPFSHQQLLPPA